MAEKCGHRRGQCTLDENGEFGKSFRALRQMKGDTVEVRCGCGHPACE